MLIFFLSVITIALAASDSLLTLSRSSSCLKDLVSDFVRAEDCSLLSDPAKVKVLLDILSSLWRWQNVFWKRWTNPFLKIATITPASWRAMRGAHSLLFTPTSITSATFTGRVSTTNVPRPSFPSSPNPHQRLSKPSGRTLYRPTRF